MPVPTSSNTWQMGDARITRVTETHLTRLTPSFLYVDWDATLLDRHPSLRGNLDAAGEHAIISIHTWVVEWAGQTILIDTGIGNHKDRPFSPMFHRLDTPFLHRLEAAGVRPDDVGHVLLTHLHADHVGWNTRLVEGGWLPTFKNARYVMPQDEVDYFATPASISRRVVFDDSVAPVIAAGQAATIWRASTSTRPRAIAPVICRLPWFPVGRRQSSRAMSCTRRRKCIGRTGTRCSARSRSALVHLAAGCLSLLQHMLLRYSLHIFRRRRRDGFSGPRRALLGRISDSVPCLVCARL